MGCLLVQHYADGRADAYFKALNERFPDTAVLGKREDAKIFSSEEEAMRLMEQLNQNGYGFVPEEASSWMEEEKDGHAIYVLPIPCTGGCFINLAEQCSMVAPGAGRQNYMLSFHTAGGRMDYKEPLYDMALSEAKAFAVANAKRHIMGRILEYQNLRRRLTELKIID